MYKIEKFQKNHTVLFCIAAEIIWLSLIMLFSLGLHNFKTKTNYFVLLALQEGLGIVVSLFLLRAAGKIPILSHKGSGIGKGLFIGLFLLVMSCLSAIAQFTAYFGKRTLQPWYFIAAFIIAVFFVGMTEEFLFRGLIATQLIEKYGTSAKGIWKAAVITSVLFGFAHFSNLIGCTAVGVFVQVVLAAVEGLLLTAIYYRSGNIWTVVILHGLVDLAGLLTSGLYGIKVTETISNYRPINLLACIIYFIPVVILLRSKKLPEIQKHFSKAVDF